MKIRTSSCYRKAKFHKIRYYKALQNLADEGHPEAMFFMIQLGEQDVVEVGE